MFWWRLGGEVVVVVTGAVDEDVVVEHGYSREAKWIGIRAPQGFYPS